MNTHTSQKQNENQRSAAIETPLIKDNEAAFQFADSRPEFLRQKEARVLANRQDKPAFLKLIRPN